MTKFFLALRENTVGDERYEAEEMLIAVLDENKQFVTSVTIVFGHDEFKVLVSDHGSLAMLNGCHGAFHLTAAVMKAINDFYMDHAGEECELYPDVFLEYAEDDPYLELDSNGAGRLIPFEL